MSSLLLRARRIDAFDVVNVIGIVRQDGSDGGHADEDRCTAMDAVRPEEMKVLIPIDEWNKDQDEAVERARRAEQENRR